MCVPGFLPPSVTSSYSAQGEQRNGFNMFVLGFPCVMAFNLSCLCSTYRSVNKGAVLTCIARRKADGFNMMSAPGFPCVMFCYKWQSDKERF